MSQKSRYQKRVAKGVVRHVLVRRDTRLISTKYYHPCRENLAPCRGHETQISRLVSANILRYQQIIALLIKLLVFFFFSNILIINLNMIEEEMISIQQSINNNMAVSGFQHACSFAVLNLSTLFKFNQVNYSNLIHQFNHSNLVELNILI